MKRIILTILMVFGVIASMNARVYLCQRENPENCERIDRVYHDGMWCEATCDNVEIPDGWYASEGDGCNNY